MKKAVTKLLAAGVAVLFVAPSLFAQTCIGDQFGKDPNCTANDSEGFLVEVVDVYDDCTNLEPGAKVKLKITYGQGNATARYDLGVFVATDGGDAVSGDCARAYATAADAGASDEDGDACYDKTSADGVVVYLDNVMLACPEKGAEAVNTNVCVSWAQNADEIDCQDLDDLRPGTPSKCVCGNVSFDNDIPLPVELASFTSEVDRSDVTLRWTTASESNNAGFAIEHSVRGGAFVEESFVVGKGTTLVEQNYSYRLTSLAPGDHKFRLKQVDFDGSSKYSPVVEVKVGVPGRYVLEAAYPNPFNPQTTLNFLVAESQPVTVGLYNPLGMLVRTLYNGTPEANTAQAVRINGSDLPSGLYIVRIEGRNFTGAQQVVLLK